MTASYIIHGNSVDEINRVMKAISADVSRAHGKLTVVEQAQAQANGSATVQHLGIGTATITLTGAVTGSGSTSVATSLNPSQTASVTWSGLQTFAGGTVGVLWNHGIWYDVNNLVYETTMSYNLGTTTLTISPTGTSWRAWVQGIPFTYVGAQTITHAATQGLWYIYINTSGVITASQTTWDLLAVAPLALIYYDAITPDAYFFDERHHYDTPVEWHQSQHFAIGTFDKYPATDFALSSYTLGQGNNAGVQWALASGTVVDEDIEILTTAIPAAGPYYVVNKTGAAGNFVRTSQVRPYISNGLATDVLMYNQYTGSTWQMTAVPNTDYMNYYIFGTTGYNATDQILLLPGQAVHPSLSTAQAESVSSMNLTGFPTLEFVPLYQITFQVNTGLYNNHGSCAIVAVTRILGSRSTVLNAPTFTNPMTAVGDLIVGDVGGAPTRLAIGGNGTVLTSNGTTESWVAPSAATITLTGAVTGSGSGSFTTSFGAAIMTTLAALANASGVLTNNGSGGLSWSASGASTGRLIDIQTFTASGTYTKATNNPSFIVVEVRGADGAFTAPSSPFLVGGGGGGGGYSRMTIANASLLATETVTVGATNAASSSFGSHCSATGGANASYAGSGAGGTGSGGSVNIPGTGGVPGAWDITDSTPSSYGAEGVGFIGPGLSGFKGIVIVYEYS